MALWPKVNQGVGPCISLIRVDRRSSAAKTCARHPPVKESSVMTPILLLLLISGALFAQSSSQSLGTVFKQPPTVTGPAPHFADGTPDLSRRLDGGWQQLRRHLHRPETGRNPHLAAVGGKGLQVASRQRRSRGQLPSIRHSPQCPLSLAPRPDTDALLHPL